METLIRNDIIKHFPAAVTDAIGRVASSKHVPVYLVGGIVRDYFLDRTTTDLDVAIPADAEGFCKELIEQLGAGAFVSLAGKKGEDSARVVLNGLTVDVSGFRLQVKTVDEDLLLRDYTINSMAADYLLLLSGGEAELIDPAGGYNDLQKGKLRLLPNAVVEDPLRMLRGYRFQARLGFALDSESVQDITQQKKTVHHVSWERKMSELNGILETDSGSKEFIEMAQTGLLQELFPELAVCAGVEQPDFHHLDVFDHCLETLACIEKILVRPEQYFSVYREDIKHYLTDKQTRIRLKWAALFHDLGKPSTKDEHKHEKGRVTFHQHDYVGSRMVGEMAIRFRFSKDDTKMVTDLIEQHMHPFHLSNLYREKQLSTRAVVRLARKAGDHLIGLFLLAMSDSLASHGRLKPETMEQEIDGLFGQVYSEYVTLIRPVQKNAKLLDGNDLIREFNLEPGPLFRQILDELELAVIEKKVKNREEALNWVLQYIKTQ